MPEFHDEERRRFDLLGFALLALSVGAFQLMMDRGQMQDWFQSTEIWFKATISAWRCSCSSSTCSRPSTRSSALAIFADRNFVISTLIGFFLGIMIYGVLSLLPPMLSALFNHPIITIGLVSAPRGLGTFMTTLIMGRLINRVDGRLLVFTGLCLSAVSALMLSWLSLDANDGLIIASGFVNGMGSSLIFVPLSAIAFTTLPRTRATKARLRHPDAIPGLGCRHLVAAGADLSQRADRRGAAGRGRAAGQSDPGDANAGRRLRSARYARRPQRRIARQATMVSYVDASGCCSSWAPPPRRWPSDADDEAG